MFMSIKSNTRALEQKLYLRICGQGEGRQVEAPHDLWKNFTQREKGLSKSEKWLNNLG